jgi:hypothetical protein
VNLVRLAVQISYKASGLGNMKFTFNLDSVKEDLPMIRPGSGFLALDLNNDGIITSEASPQTDKLMRIIIPLLEAK